VLKQRPRLRFPGAQDAPVRVSGPSEEDTVISDLEARLSAGEDTWTTKDGRRMLIRDMSDPHLLSTISFLRRGLRGMSLKVLGRLQTMEKEWERRYGKRP
jgi:hypothetical protein